jgi:hypothetical protein
MVDNSETTIRFAIRDAIASTAHLHNIRPDRHIKEIEDALFESLTRDDIVWAWDALLGHSAQAKP